MLREHSHSETPCSLLRTKGTLHNCFYCPLFITEMDSKCSQIQLWVFFISEVNVMDVWPVWPWYRAAIQYKYILLLLKVPQNPHCCTYYPPGRGLKCHQAPCLLTTPHQFYCHPSSLEQPPRDPPALLSLPQWDCRQSRTGSTAVMALNCLPLACQPASVLEKCATHPGKIAALPQRRPLLSQRVSTTRWMRRLWEQ